MLANKLFANGSRVYQHGVRCGFDFHWIQPHAGDHQPHIKKQNFEEPAVDLGVIMALASGFRNQPVDSGMAVFGEVGLTGEVRAISQAEMRLKEAAKMGFSRCLMPQNNINRLTSDTTLELVGVNSVEQALDII